MTHWEKRAWINLAIAVVGYAVYLVLVLGGRDGRPLTSTPYAAAMLATIGAGIAAAIAAEIVLAVVNPRASRLADDRDKEIGRLGDHIGNSFVAIGAVAAMVMAMAGWAHFWIANVIYLAFILSAILAGITKVIVYRRSMPAW